MFYLLLPTYYLLINTNNYKSIIIIMTSTFKRNLMSKSKRRIKRDAGGRSKNPKPQLLARNSRLDLDKPSGKTYIKFTRKK